jgi:hypothetical protein
MDAAERLENHEPSILDELVQAANDEKVVQDDGLAFVQLEASAFKVKVDVQMFQKFCDWIPENDSKFNIL